MSLATLKPAGALNGLPAARRQLLLALKELGELSAETLAARLEVTASAVRQQLAPLVARGWVEVRQVRGQTGRPKFRYALGPAAEGLFPKAYGDLANELLDHVQTQDPVLVEDLFERRRVRRVERARERLAGKDFPGRVRELATILDEDGYLAELADDGQGGYRLVEHNCAILDVARRWGQACSSEIEFLREALPEADIRRVAHMLGGAHVCAYEVKRKQ